MRELLVDFDRAAGTLGLQLTAALRCAVREGRLAPNTRLPSTRTLATDLGVSRGVVTEAYEQLVGEGYLAARQGSGTRVTSACSMPVPASEERPLKQREFAYDLTPGRPDLTSFPRRAWAAAVRHVLNTAPHDVLGYPAPAGTQELRDVLADHLGRVRAVSAAADRITITGGVAQGLALVCRVLGRRGHTVLAVEDPSTHRQSDIFSLNGLHAVGVPVDAEGIDVDALHRSGARAVLVTPAHQYPTGVVLSARRRTELVAWAHAVEGCVIEDDYDAEFRYDRDPVGCLQGLAPERVVHLGSTSKALAPGLRLGWAALPGDLVEEVQYVKTNTDLGSPVLSQLTLVRLLETGAYDRHLRSVRLRYRARRDALVDALGEFLPGATVHGVAAGLHLYVELPVEEDLFVERAAARGVRVEPVGPMRRSPGPPAVVLGYAALNEARLREAVALLAS
jgi:GntR family transcriptional regulator/MocR family aminotransferase